MFPNSKGFQGGLFDPWIYPAKMPNDLSPIPKPFRFLIETGNYSMAEQIRKTKKLCVLALKKPFYAFFSLWLDALLLRHRHRKEEGRPFAVLALKPDFATLHFH